MTRTNASRQAAYRARQKEGGIKPSRGKSGKKGKNSKSGKSKTLFQRGEFIALDGEGENRGEAKVFSIDGGKTYHAREHHYTMLAASSGESLYNNGERLDSHACIDFLCDLGSNYKRAIFVIFAGSYDVNHMVMFGFSRDQLKIISKGVLYEYERDGIIYSLEYRARKSLTIRRGKTWYINNNGKYCVKWKDKIVVWDVWGFFQDNFVTVIRKWLGEDYVDYAMIKDMKARRGNFSDISQSIINEYNAAELRALVLVMDKVRDAVEGLGLVCRRWDGAGSIAAAIMRKHNIKEFKGQAQPGVIEAARIAYAGGRIEVCKIGSHNGSVYDYDVNSAYPSVMIDLPCMAHGQWIKGEGEPPLGFTLVHVVYDFADDLPFYPFFYRNEHKQIRFPAQGEGWYWYPEFEAAQLCDGKIDVIEWWHWQAACNHKPFHWIPEYYNTRQQWVKHATEEWQKGGEKIIKLGLNSLYGKTAQQLGGNLKAPPPYHQLEWAGYITSATRARLFTAAMTMPESVIGFATDGIFTTSPLPIECSTTKQMGAWELKTPEPNGMTIAMAGVYWWHLNDKYDHFSRGFDKDSMRTPHPVISAWKDGKDSLDIPMYRLIGMGSACASDVMYEMRGRFTESMRTLRLNGRSHKRVDCNVKRSKLHQKLNALDVFVNKEYLTGVQGCSHPFPVVWLDENDEDYQNDLELQREHGDTENI